MEEIFLVMLVFLVIVAVVDLSMCLVIIKLKKQIKDGQD